MAIASSSRGEFETGREAAHNAGLHYADVTRPGIGRARSGRGFTYRRESGEPVRDKATRFRIRSLVIPPAWEDVWICPDPLGHVQATGRDEKGRKQYIYHAQWREVRDEAKFDRLIDFAAALPRIRRRVARDLARPGLPVEKVLATVVRLLDESSIRIGNEEYARKNRSFGLTTLRNRHVDITGATLRFSFTGKSGRRHTVGVRDRRLARIVKRLQDLPGQSLFQYRDDNGELRGIDSEDVNTYLREISGTDFTAKDFRTWAGTVLAVAALRDTDPPVSAADARRKVKKAVESVALVLGNTPAVCRASYIHPDVLQAYLDGSLNKQSPEVRSPAGARRTSGLRRDEQRALALLRREA
jgi:DNA topoisomerase-1